MNKLLKAIKEKETTISELADKCDLSYQALWYIKGGKRQPLLHTADKIALELNVSIYDIFDLRSKQ